MMDIALTIMLLLLLSVGVDYPQCDATTLEVGCPQFDVTTLEADILSAPYSPSAYKLHSFDCSEMSGILEEHLTRQGWDARIIVLEKDAHDCIRHVQVIVYADDTYFIVESTAKRVVEGTMPGFTVMGEYDNRSDAAENSVCGYTEWYVGLGGL